jgi:hypothetical protein
MPPITPALMADEMVVVVMMALYLLLQSEYLPHHQKLNLPSNMYNKRKLLSKTFCWMLSREWL